MTLCQEVREHRGFDVEPGGVLRFVVGRLPRIMRPEIRAYTACPWS
jgi:hypothetical protein